MWLFEKLKDIGGAAIGVFEMFGLKYPVKTYMSQVSDTLWRGSRLPNLAAYQALKAKGINCVVNLCAENDMDAILCDSLSIRHERIFIIDNTAPTSAQMLLFLETADNPLNRTFVHCEAGKGRTGVAVACYRMAIQGWSFERAVAEAERFGLTLQDQKDFLKKFAADGVTQWRKGQCA